MNRKPYLLVMLIILPLVVFSYSCGKKKTESIKVKQQKSLEEKFKKLMNEGQSLLEQEKWYKAADVFKSAVKINPNNPDGHFWLGVTLKKMGGFDKALEEFRKTVELDKGYSKAYYYIAELMVNQGKYEDALMDLQKMKETMPDSPEPYVASSIVYLSMAKRKMVDEGGKRTPESIKFEQLSWDEAEKALSIDSTAIDAYLTFGEIYEIKKQKNEAIKQYKKFIELCSQDSTRIAEVRDLEIHIDEMLGKQ